MSDPISVEQYRAQVLDGVEPLEAVQLPLAQCLGLVTASSVTAHVAVPVFTNSAMDGFAVHAADVASAAPDTPVTLQVTGEVPAGSITDDWVGDGQAVRIMTGAPLPAGADAVVQIERTDQPVGAAPLPEKVQIFASVAEGANIRLAGEDVSEGELVLAAGTELSAACLAAAAATGHGTLSVHRRVRVAIISTGAELVAAGQPLDRGQIHDSNSVLLAGLATQAGAEVVLATRCSDEAEALDNAIAEAVRVADVIVTTGGVSAGTHDVVKNSKTAAALHFQKVQMQPGKPQGMGRLTSPDGRQVTLLALPGNPVSVFVSWHCYGVPLVARLAGLDAEPSTTQARAGIDWTTPKGRRQFIPVRLADGEAWPVHKLGSGSHLIASLHLADALAVIPAEVDEVHAGDQVEILGFGGQR